MRVGASSPWYTEGSDSEAIPLREGETSHLVVAPCLILTVSRAPSLPPPITTPLPPQPHWYTCTAL